MWKKFFTVSCLLFVSHISEPYPALCYCLYFQMILCFLRLKLDKKGYKSKSRKICIFGVLTCTAVLLNTRKHVWLKIKYVK